MKGLLDKPGAINSVKLIKLAFHGHRANKIQVEGNKLRLRNSVTFVLDTAEEFLRRNYLDPYLRDHEQQEYVGRSDAMAHRLS